MTIRVAIIGGGIHGTLVALNLAQLGIEADIFEARPELWGGATFAGEGKIHLGYVYGHANDETLVSLLQTAQRFSEDFEASLQRRLDWDNLTSSPFEYGIPETSLISGETFQRHAIRIAELAKDQPNRTHISYLGKELPLGEILARQTDQADRFCTPERAVDMPALKTMVLNAIDDNSSIAVHAATRVTEASFQAGRWTLTCQSTGNQSTLDECCGEVAFDRSFDYVVNCAWENAAFLDHKVDQTPDFSPDGSLPNLRLRLFVHAQSDAPPTALTLTLGRFGDYVVFPDGRTYASWYPSGLLGFSQSLQPPSDWTNLESQVDATEYVSSVIDALSQWVPDVRRISNPSVHARIVVARGQTDIDDPASQLHQRSAHGLAITGSWISVRSYKLTTAPATARLVYEHLKEFTR